MQNRESTSCARVGESRAHPVFNQSSGGFICNICVWLSHLPAGQSDSYTRVSCKLHEITVIYEQRARIGKIFSRWHLATAITSIAPLLISFALLLIVVNLK